MSFDAAAGASNTVSPGRASPAAAVTTCPIAPSSVLDTSTTGTLGACRARAAAICARSMPSRTAPVNRSATPATRSLTSTPLSCPPATQTIRGYAVNEAYAACGLVALESSTYATPLTVATWALRCGSGRYPASPPSTASAPTPYASASAAAASALLTLCRPGGRIPSASISPPVPNARSVSQPSRTPSCPGSGSPTVNPTAWPVTRGSASATRGSSRLPTAVPPPSGVAERQMASFARAYAAKVPCHSRWSSARLSSAPACGASWLDQCSWKLDSSTASTSYAVADTNGSPMLPRAAVRSPAAVRIAASIVVVVVLPLVPVTASQAGASGVRSRQASSGSLYTGSPAACAATTSARVRANPGETTTSDTSSSSRGGGSSASTTPTPAAWRTSVRPLAPLSTT